MIRDAEEEKASAAAMRERLLDLDRFLRNYHQRDHAQIHDSKVHCEEIARALSGDAGRALLAERDGLRAAAVYARDRRGSSFDFDEWSRLVEHALKGEHVPSALEDEIARHSGTLAALNAVRAELDALREVLLAYQIGEVVVGGVIYDVDVEFNRGEDSWRIVASEAVGFPETCDAFNNLFANDEDAVLAFEAWALAQGYAWKVYARENRRNGPLNGDSGSARGAQPAS